MSVAPAIDERVVSDLWERQAFEPAVLASLGLHVVYRGVPSDAGGPDYQDALVSTADAGLMSGDVEFHVQSSDWYAHGHDRNPAYNDVILHVVWIDDAGATVREDGELVATAALRDYVDLLPQVSRQPALHEHPCIASYASVSTAALGAAIVTAGTRRFEERSGQFAAEMLDRPPEEAFYTALFESLGYASNRDTFRALAEAVPFAWLQSVEANYWVQVLLDAARLGPPGRIAPPARLPANSWRLTRLRPSNHPARRIEAVVSTLKRLGPRPVETLATTCASARRASDLRDPLLTRSPDGGVIGKGRADEIVASVVLPFLGGYPDCGERAYDLYCQYPSPPYNRWTRVMLQRFAAARHDIRPRSVIQHQGIHHLYHRHCRYERPDGCPVCGSER